MLLELPWLPEVVYTFPLVGYPRIGYSTVGISHRHGTAPGTSPILMVGTPVPFDYLVVSICTPMGSTTLVLTLRFLRSYTKVENWALQMRIRNVFSKQCF